MKNVDYIYDESHLEVLKDVNLAIKDEEFVCIIGPSGCGKTTLLNLVAGFETPSSGTILENGVAINGISYERAVVFQQDAVFPWLTVYQNVEYGLRVRKIDRTERAEITEHFIDLVGLTDFKDAYPRQLSGGMKKRVDLARALANNPKILLMDEPFGALDAITKEKLQMQLMRIWESDKKIAIFITHDIEEALFLGDRVILLSPARLNHEIDILDIPFERPRNLKLKENVKFQQIRRQVINKLTHMA